MKPESMVLEPLLTSAGTKDYSFAKPKYADLKKFYDVAQAANWTEKEINMVVDIDHWKKLTQNEQFFLKNILGFFNQSDGIVNENLVLNFYTRIKQPECLMFYSFQIMIEVVHSLTYSMFIENLVEDDAERDFLFDSIGNNPIVAKKAKWAMDWIDGNKIFEMPEFAGHEYSDEQRDVIKFISQLIAFSVVEGIFFSGSFCSIFYMKSRGLMPGLSQANKLISRDEGLHADYACHLYRYYIKNKFPVSVVRRIVLDAVEIEKEFVSSSLPVDLIGMNSKLMQTYIEFVSDRLLVALGLEKEFHSGNPFPFMEAIANEDKVNFFEANNTDYKLHTGSTVDTTNTKFTIDF